VFLLTWLTNKLRVKKINIQEQFIMAYGGLRGAIAFSMVEMLNMETVGPRALFVTTTLVVIIFTVFIQVLCLIFFLCL
jgi:NhaP-type Na+/H+ or K+/H+ antiporter